MEVPQIDCKPVRWEILPEFYPEYGKRSGGVYVELRRNREGEELYAVVLVGSYALNKETGDWDREPIPSERTVDYLATHRYPSLASAILDAKRAAHVELGEVL